MPKEQPGGAMAYMAYASVALAVIGLISFIAEFNFSIRDVDAPPFAPWEYNLFLFLLATAFFSLLIGLGLGIAPIYSQNENTQGFAMLGAFSNAVLLVVFCFLQIYACSGGTFVISGG